MESERDEALRLAREAGISLWEWGGVMNAEPEQIERLVSLARSRPGWKFVPEEPTAEMLESMWGDHPADHEVGREMWAAMLAAAPSPGDAE